MRDYEVVYIFKSSLTTEEIESRLEAYHARILGTKGSEITAVEHWGKRQLAYPIDRNDNGYYIVTQFTAPPSVLPEFERALKLDDDLLRHLVVLSEGELAAPLTLDVDDESDDSADDEDRYRASERSREPAAAADDEADQESAAEEDDAAPDDEADAAAEESEADAADDDEGKD